MIEKIKELLDQNRDLKIALIAFCGVLIISLIFSIYTSSTNKNYKEIKIDTKKDYVYDREYDTINDTKIPFININTDKIKQINETFVETYEEFMTNEKNIFTYSYAKSKNYISILIWKSRNNEKENGLDLVFESYIIDLNTKEILSQSQVRKIFNVSESDVNKTLEKKFKSHYDHLVKEGYIPTQECDYNCFLEWREIDEYLDDAQYFIENGSLYVYRGFNIYSVYGEDEYFGDDNFKFLVKK